MDEPNVSIGSLPKTEDQILRATLIESVTAIERLEEEDAVMDMLFKGLKPYQVAEKLREKYPNERGIDNIEVQNFIDKSPFVAQFLKKRYQYRAKKLLDSQERCAELVANIILQANELIDKYSADDDRLATIAAVRAVNGLVDTFSELQGFKKTNMLLMPITVTEQISKEKQESLARKVVSVSFTKEEKKEAIEKDDGQIQPEFGESSKPINAEGLEVQKVENGNSE